MHALLISHFSPSTDIGADHGILSAAASFRTNNEVYAIERSLAAAKKGLIPLINNLNTGNRIKVFVGNGLEPLLENKIKVNTIVLAGMGATTAAQILCRCNDLNFTSHKSAISANESAVKYVLSDALDTLFVERIILQVTPPNLIPLLSVFKIIVFSGWKFEKQVNH